jgi:hypothetical protein
MGALDPLDEINASTGAAGSADSILIMKRSDRTADDATLFVTGRDIEEPAEHALSWDNPSKTWKYKGHAEDHNMTGERTEICNVLRTLDRPAGPHEIADILRKDGGAVRRLILKLFEAGELVRPSHGKYALPTTGNVGNSGNDDNSGNEGNGTAGLATVTALHGPGNDSSSKTPANGHSVTAVTDVTEPAGMLPPDEWEDPDHICTVLKDDL